MPSSARRVAILLIAIGACLVARPACAGDLREQFDARAPELRRKLRSPRVEQRIEAIKTLGQFPFEGSALLIHGCFSDDNDRVRSAAFDALQAMNDEQEVCDALLAEARRSLESHQEPEMVLPALAALLASELPLAQVRTQEFLDGPLADSTQGVELLVELADQLGMHAKSADVMPLARLSNTRLFAEHFGLRRAVVHALTKTPSDSSIDPLVSMLDVVGGEARADAIRYLTKVTGQGLGFKAEPWQKWREVIRSRRDTAPGNVPAQLTVTVTKADELESEAGQYYGIPLFAERLVFVLDISGSMQGGRMLAAKRELIRAIENLPDYAHFGIVVFNGSVDRWQHKLLPANAKNKKSAVHYVERQSPEGNTASSDALDAAFTYDTEAIYLLSDGAPTAGKIRAPVDIIQAVTATNRLRRISVYTIGIAPGFPGSPTDEFLRVLSEKNAGQYRRVDG